MSATVPQAGMLMVEVTVLKAAVEMVTGTLLLAWLLHTAAVAFVVNEEVDE
jgi:hypothetical protein